MSPTFAYPAGAVARAGYSANEYYYSESHGEETASQTQVARALELIESIPEMSQAPKSVRTRVARIISTRSGGVPEQYPNAWAWAADWVKSHGVTLPPDTSDYRSLRNWFCYQVNMFRKGQLSKRSVALLNEYGIDLSQYRAPNTGRGELFDDRRMILKMQEHNAITGSYDLPEDADAELLEWQRRLLDAYLVRGVSARMKAIEAQLPGFEYGLWMRPNETPIPSSQMGWWHRAREFRSASKEYPAFRGKIDPRMPQYLGMWAAQQITDHASGKLSKRQRAELVALNIIAGKDHLRSRERSLALQQARAVMGLYGAAAPSEERQQGNHERNLKMFLGAALLARLLNRNATLPEIYATLCITPVQFDRIRKALDLIMVPLVSLSRKSTLTTLRECYAAAPAVFDNARSAQAIPPEVFDGLGSRQRNDVTRLAGLIIEVRELMRQINVRQDLLPTHAREDAPLQRAVH